MISKTWWRTTLASLIAVVLVLSLLSCSNRAVSQTISRIVSPSPPSGDIAEVSPPEVIQTLREALEGYQPQVAILSPQPDMVFQDNTLTARFQVKDLPIFKNPELELGPHLHVILDNQPYIAVYDLNQPLVFPDLAPGTHTLRVFASRPWHESFKNEGAYAQTTFHIFTKTQDNNPNPAQPLLTYSRPKGSYGAEPILLDFYLTNAPLHIAAQENPNDDIADWRVRCTINGNSFVLDRWQPVYLKGFKPGKNWVQLEFIDEQGNTVKNVFNSTIRLITYEPKGKDTLSRLVRGELSATEARGIVELKSAAETPAPSASPTPTLTPASEKTPDQVGEDRQAEPEIESKSTDQEQEPVQSRTPTGGFFNRFRRPSAIPSPSLPPTLPIIESPTPEPIAPPPEPQPLVTPSDEPPPAVAPAPPMEVQPKDAKQPEKPKPGGFFNRFRRKATPSPNLPPTLPEIINEPAPEEVVPETTKPQPQASLSPTPSLAPTTPLEATPAAKMPGE